MRPARAPGLCGLMACAALAQQSSASETVPKFLSLPLSKNENGMGLARRQQDFSMQLAYDNDTYLVDVQVGTPPQRMKLSVDIGTYATWLISSCESLYFHKDECAKSGVYNRSESDTVEYISSDYYGDQWFDLQDGDSHSFSYFADDFQIGDEAPMKNLTFGIKEFPSTMQYGTLGLGFGKGVNTNASSMMDELVSRGVIDHKSFGLAVGRNHTDDGSLILGGLDTKKFAGALHKIPIVDPPTYPFDYDEYRYWIELDDVTLNDGLGNTTTAEGFRFMPQSIDHISYLPNEVVDNIAAAFGVTNTSVDDWYIVSCQWKDYVNGSLELNFPDFSVEIPYREFIIQNDIRDAMEDECYITAIPRSEERHQGLWYMGHVFLRQVYAVFDQEEKAVWLAKYQDCGSEAVPFTGGAEVKGQCKQSSSGGRGGGEDGDDSDGGDSDGDNSGVRTGMSIALAVTALVTHLALS